MNNVILFGYEKWFHQGKMVMTAEPMRAWDLSGLPGRSCRVGDGTWKIIEAGDGEVSGLSDGQDYEAFFRTLYHCFA